MQEATIQLKSGNADFRMDQLIIQAEVTLTYQYKPIFQVLNFLSAKADWNREITQTADYRYGS